MVEYTINKNDIKLRVNALFFSSVVGVFVLLGFCVLLTVFFLLVGFLYDAESKVYGYGLLICVVIMAVFLLVKYCFLVRKSKSNFDATCEDGQIVIRFESTETHYVLSNLTTGSSFQYEKNSVETIKYYKKMIVLRFRGGKTEILPNNDEIRSVGNFDSLGIK